MMNTRHLFLAAGALLFSVPALAQPGHEGHDHAGHSHAPAKPVVAQPVPAPPPVTKTHATFSEDEFKAIAMAMSGCRSAVIEGSGEVVLAVAPVGVSGASNTMYAELSFANAMNRPFRQTIWQLDRVDGKVHLKTYEFRAKPDHIAGMWAAPETFPPLSLDWMRMTMEMEVTREGEGYRARTLKPYPSTVNGADSMTSEIVFDAETFVTSDRGYDKEGKLVWGPAEGASGYTFKNFAGGPVAVRSDDGLVVINYPGQVKGDPAKPGERIAVEYMGYLENGRMFDASYSRGSPFVYAQGDKLIEGWNRGMKDVREGTVRRIIIPAALAHGDTTGNGKVPPNSTLIYDVKVKAVGAAAVTSTPPPAPGVKAAPGAVAPQLQPVDPNDPVIKKMEADMRARMEAKAKARAEKEAAEQAEKEKQGKPADPQPAPKK